MLKYNPVLCFIKLITFNKFISNSLKLSSAQYICSFSWLTKDCYYSWLLWTKVIFNSVILSYAWHSTQVIPYCGLDHPLVQDSLDANSINPVEEMEPLVEHPTLQIWPFLQIYFMNLVSLPPVFPADWKREQKVGESKIVNSCNPGTWQVQARSSLAT